MYSRFWVSLPDLPFPLPPLLKEFGYCQYLLPTACSPNTWPDLHARCSTAYESHNLYKQIRSPPLTGLVQNQERVHQFFCWSRTSTTSLLMPPSVNLSKNIPFSYPSQHNKGYCSPSSGMKLISRLKAICPFCVLITLNLKILQTAHLNIFCQLASGESRHHCIQALILFPGFSYYHPLLLFSHLAWWRPDLLT